MAILMFISLSRMEKALGIQIPEERPSAVPAKAPKAEVKFIPAGHYGLANVMGLKPGNDALLAKFIKPAVVPEFVQKAQRRQSKTSEQLEPVAPVVEAVAKPAAIVSPPTSNPTSIAPSPVVKKSPVQEDPTNPIVEQAPKRTGLDVSLGLQSIEVKAAPVSQREAERKALRERLDASEARTLQKRKEEKEQARKNIAAREASRKLMRPFVPESEKAVLQALAAQYKSLGHYE